MNLFIMGCLVDDHYLCVSGSGYSVQESVPFAPLQYPRCWQHCVLQEHPDGSCVTAATRLNGNAGLNLNLLTNMMDVKGHLMFEP